MQGALHGVRVLDLSRILAGPWATQLLGDYGADVVKVERPGIGDDTRRFGPPWLGEPGDDSAYFLSTNRNKRSVTVDIANEAGATLIRKLADKADVLIENFKVGTMARAGLDAASLRASNGALIICSISAYGQSGSRASEPGYDAMIQASGGLMSITGAPDLEGGSPQKVGVAIADIMAGMYAATAILAALRVREASGEGQVIDVPLYDSQVAWLANQNMNYLVGGEVPQRLGTAHPNIVPYQTLSTLDGFLMLTVGNDRQFRTCVEILGLPDLADDPLYSTNAARVDNRERLITMLESRLRAKTTSHWLARLKSAGVPCGPINDIETVLTDDYAREHRLVRHQRHPVAGETPTVANPVRFSATPVTYEKSPPLLGQHTGEVLHEWLGYSADSIGRLKAAGAI